MQIRRENSDLISLMVWSPCESSAVGSAPALDRAVTLTASYEPAPSRGPRIKKRRRPTLLKSLGDESTLRVAHPLPTNSFAKHASLGGPLTFGLRLEDGKIFMS
ncbi:hypothetical protein NW759_009291 [Fusarium solani]|nr:hypothetical protein NW759_009291 [Fusarium solani]